MWNCIQPVWIYTEWIIKFFVSIWKTSKQIIKINVGIHKKKNKKDNSVHVFFHIPAYSRKSHKKGCSILHTNFGTQSGWVWCWTVIPMYEKNKHIIISLGSKVISCESTSVRSIWMIKLLTPTSLSPIDWLFVIVDPCNIHYTKRYVSSRSI
jgi:hypothetical protein